MMRLRPVRQEDLVTVLEMAGQTGGGMTSLPPDETMLKRRIALSIESFGRAGADKRPDYYLMVLEKDGKLAGTTGVFAAVGLDEPFYSYRLLDITQVCRNPQKSVHTQMLQLVNDFAGATELGTLFLMPDHRGGGAGQLLSKGRYLLLASHPQRFSSRVMAEIRGWVDETGRSPFWEAVGRHFFDMDFHEADRINAGGNQQFIADLMPKFPLYKALLPPDAQAVIGKPHDAARPAIRLLEDEGFRFAGAVDIFDAGPSLAAPMTALRTVNAATRARAVRTAESPGGRRILVANPDLQRFRIVPTLSPAAAGEAVLALDAVHFEALDLDGDGAEVVWAPLDKKESAQ